MFKGQKMLLKACSNVLITEMDCTLYVMAWSKDGSLKEEAKT